MKPKKSLGQNFFVNKNLGDYIINKVAENNTHMIVEIGPGQGFFTEKLIKIYKKVTVVEKDSDLADELKIKYPSITILNEDFLDLDLRIFKDTQITYFGSLPYNVSKPIIRKIVESDSFNTSAYFIIQKEVAEKYKYCKPYNILSLSTAIYASVEKIFDISPSSFNPKPNVNSSFVSMIPQKDTFNDIEKLKKLILLSFKQPRKTLRNNLRNTEFSTLIHEYGNNRPSDLSLTDYKKILDSNLV
jgi:16S rRNA (adenine1518-N6/adenine1519-N6)-dimethyltransferase